LRSHCDGGAAASSFAAAAASSSSCNGFCASLWSPAAAATVAAAGRQRCSPRSPALATERANPLNAKSSQQKSLLAGDAKNSPESLSTLLTRSCSSVWT
jgi:hypothetical protein